MTRKQKCELDKLLSLAVRARDKVCRRCGATQRLSAAHIYPKGKYTKMRWDTDNVILCCYRCHMEFMHKNPIEAAEWLQSVLSKERWSRLRIRTQVIDKAPQDYEILKLFLEAEARKYA